MLLYHFYNFPLTLYLSSVKKASFYRCFKRIDTHAWSYVKE